MKGTINKAIIIGKLGNDPEIKYAQNGNAICRLTVATNDGYKDKKTGQLIENTEWHRVVFFGKQADFLSKYATKGTTIYVEGKIKTTKWQDNNNQDRYTTEIIANEVQIVGNKMAQEDAPKFSRPSANKQNSFNDDVPF